MENKTPLSNTPAKQQSILIIVNDDDSGLLAEILSDQGYKVHHSFADGALCAVVNETLPNLIIINIEGSPPHGLDLCRKLNTHAGTSNIPVICIGTLPELNDKEKAFEAGCHDFITKPFSSSEVLARIRNCLLIQQYQQGLEKVINDRTIELQTKKNKLEQELQRRKQLEIIKENQFKLLSLTADIGKALIQGQTVSEMLGKCCELIVNYLDAAFTRAWIFDDTQNLLEMKASAGMYTRINGKHCRKKISSDNKIGYIALTKSPYITNSVIGDPQVVDQEWVKQKKIISFAGHPLLVDDTVIGVIATFSQKTMPKMVIKSLESVADEIALGIHRKLSEASLHASQKQFRELIEDTVDWIWETDREKIFTYSSPRVFDLLGYHPHEIIGKPIFTLMPSSEVMRMEMMFQKMDVTQEHCSAIENINVHKNGGNRIHETSARPIFDGKGVFCGYRGINRDITRRKQAHEEKIRLEAQLQQSQKMEAIGTLAGGIAHDFNNILAAIIGYTELAISDLTDKSEKKRQLLQALNAGNRAKQLVKQILTFSRKSEPGFKLLQIQPIIKESLTLLRASLPATIEIKTDITANCDTILADPTQIHQIVMNLCTNAYHAMKDTGGILTVALKQIKLNTEDISDKINLRPGSYLKLEIGDTGAGIQKKNLNKIFEPYFTTKKQGEGTGLGLAVVHGIIKKMQGDIFVISDIGKGTLFRVYLPVNPNLKASLLEKTITPMPRGNERILLVEENETTADMHRQLIETLGYSVDAFTNSMTAFDTFRKTPENFDLVIMDVALRNMTGKELAGRMLELKSDIPIVLCTDDDEMINLKQADRMGIRDYILKPVLKRVLADKIRKNLDCKKE